MIDVCVVTYNRLPYLQKCVWSILATKPGACRLIVGDDCSDDGSREWLTEMHKRGLISVLNLNEKQLGTFGNLNKTIRSSETDYFTIIMDDFYLHRGWYQKSLETIRNYDDCGIVSFYNNTRLTLDYHEKINDNLYKIQRSGLGAAIINRELFEKSGGYPLLSEGKCWGYRASDFCAATQKVDIKRNQHYQLFPFYAYDMDCKASPLNEIEAIRKYRERRYKDKYNKSLPNER